MKIKTVAIDKLKPYENNPRNNEDAVDSVAASIQEFGWQQMIVVDKDMVIIAGHTRLLAAKKLGLTEIPVKVASELTPEQVQAFRIADNKTAERATWNHDLLKVELEALQAADYDLTLTGFDMDEIKKALQNVQIIPPAADPNSSPGNLPDEPESIQGDFYQIGPHRLQCGDSTDITQVENLLSGNKADLVFTDPPYGVNFRARKTDNGQEKDFNLIKGDELQGEALTDFIRDAILNAVAVTKEDAAFYICFPWRTYSQFQEAVEGCGLEIDNCIIWDKGSIGLSEGHYRPQHELIFYIRGNTFNAGKDQSNVWEFSRGNTAKNIHPTQKPVELVEKAIQNSSNPAEIVLDLFGGSGSTMVAAQSSGRIAYLMELEPKNCDKIVERMHELWPDLPITRNGVKIEFS